jgi:2-phosphoglycerate kinase
MQTQNAGYEHALWIGGSTFAGKSTVSGILAERHGFRTYHCDDMFLAHIERIDPEKHPTFHLIVHKAGTTLFMLPPNVLLAGIQALAREEFGMILDDVAAMAAERGRVLVEGAQVLPDCVTGVLKNKRRAVWLVSAESFLRDHYVTARETLVKTILAPYRDPDRALRNWMARDIAFGQWVREQAHTLGFGMIEVDGTRSAERVARMVEEYFELV